MSASGVPTVGSRELYFAGPCPGAGCIAGKHHIGDGIFTAVSATHTVKFTLGTGVPASGKIVITFPGVANNTASPSATNFAFNQLAAANVTVTGTAACPTGQIVVSSPSITCTPNAGIASNTTLTFVFNLINPIKLVTTGTADNWKVSIQTQDSIAGNPILESGFAKIGTIESVQVQAIVEPTLSFTIFGVNDNVNINTIGTCGDSILTNSGINSSPNFVNLGLLFNGKLSKAAQKLEVSTNGSSGYAITATSSGQFMNPATGYALNDANAGGGNPGRNPLTANDAPAPSIITVGGSPGVTAFGIHACGARSNIGADIWAENSNQTAADYVTGTAKFSNPWNASGTSYYATIASYTGGPVGTDDTAILYGATVTGSTPAGLYSNYYTYVATATF